MARPKGSSSSLVCSTANAAQAGGVISDFLNVLQIWCSHWNAKKSASEACVI